MPEQDTVDRPQTEPRRGESRGLIVRQPDMAWLDIPREELVPTLQASLFPGAKPDSIAAVLDYCEAAGLNVMLKPVHIVPMNVKVGQNKWEWRDIVMPGINHYRTQASRTGTYVGKTEPEFGNMVERQWGTIKLMVPEWCKITVKRLISGHVASFTAIEFWDENFATAGRDKQHPNAMWMRRPRGQLAKCTEAQAIRMAFPELISGETAEEMEGKVIDLQAIEITDHKPAAARSLDAFAGKEESQPEPVPSTGQSDEPEDAEVTPVKECPVMTAKALKAWVEKQDWKPGWEWLNKTFVAEGTAHGHKQELAERHNDLLWAVYHSDADKNGPQSKAAAEFAETHRIVIPPLVASDAD